MPRRSELPTVVPAEKLTGSIAEQVTIRPDAVPWITRIRGTRTSIDPKATVSYIVARDEHGSSTLWAGEDVPHRVREHFAPGIVLQDRYRLIKELGRGGMGVVYLAVDQRLDRSVAVKVILSHDASASATATMDTRVKSSFAEEARLGASLTHPAIATVFDYGFHHDSPFTIFEYMEGETLRDLIDRRGRLPLDEVRLIIGPLAQALDFAHERRIVHRDLKPENIRATAQRLFKVLDLGLAREFSRQEDWRFAGTPAYAAPEQAAERPSDGRTDQYALAVIIFELLTGRRPFISDSWLDLLEMHYSAQPPSPRGLDPNLPETIDEAIVKALEKDPNRRFSTCTELAVALGCQFLTGPAPLPTILIETDVKRMGGRWKTVFYPFSFKHPRTHLALAPDALWAIHRTELMRWPIAALHDVRRRRFRGISFRIRGIEGNDRQWFRFNSRPECKRWLASLEALVVDPDRPLSPGETDPERTIAPPISQEPVTVPRVEPVVLLKGRPGTRFQLLGAVEAKGPSRRRAENGLAIRAAMMGADAVLDLNAERLPGFVKTEHRASGTAVRVVDDEGRMELKSRWFAGQMTHIRLPMLLLAFLLGGIGEIARVSVNASIGQEVNRPFVSSRLDSAFNGTFWIVICTLTLGMFVSRWPQLVRPVSICFLARAAQHALGVVAALVGIVTVGLTFLWTGRGFIPLGDMSASVMASTLMVAGAVINLAWSFSFFLLYLYLGRRSWRVDQEFRSLASGSPRLTTIPWARRATAGIAWALACAFAVCLVGLQVTKTGDSLARTIAAGAGGSQARDQRKAAFAKAMNEIAWRQLTDPDPAKRIPDAALREAEQVVASEPQNALYVSTLGVARYRTGNFTGAITDLERSIALGFPGARNGFFLAAAHAELGHLSDARKIFDEADEWMRIHKPEGPELKRFREEAAATLFLESRKSK